MAPVATKTEPVSSPRKRAKGKGAAKEERPSEEPKRSGTKRKGNGGDDNKRPAKKPKKEEGGSAVKTESNVKLERFSTSDAETRALTDAVKAMRTKSDLSALIPYAKPLEWYVPGRTIHVDDKMQSGYSYELSAEVGDLPEGFDPVYTPGEMLALGVFEGKYLNDCVLEFPREWYEEAFRLGKLCPGRPDVSVNALQVDSRKPLSYWREKGWIPIRPGCQDVRGWFQWYCRYYIGRRDENVDEVQIKRWRAFTRHAGQIKAAYRRMDPADVPKTVEEKSVHRARQRQGLLQWSHDPYV